MADGLTFRACVLAGVRIDDVLMDEFRIAESERVEGELVVEILFGVHGQLSRAKLRPLPRVVVRSAI